MQVLRTRAWQRLPYHLRRTAAIVAAVLASLVLFLWLFSWSILAAPLAALASHTLHRKVQIGRLSAHLLRWTPTVTIENLRVANVSWTQGPYMAQIGSITIGIEPWQLLGGHLVLSRLEITDPQLVLQRDAHNRANWDFDAATEKPPPPKPGGKPLHLPAVKLFTLRGGQLSLEDAIHKLQFQGRIVANEHAARPERQPLRIEGHGELNAEPFQLTFAGGALFDLQLNQPYRFDATINAGPLSAIAHGEIDKPFDFGHFGAWLDLRGQNLAGVYYLTGLALPFTPPFHISGQLRNDDNRFAFQQIQATVGSSDLAGEMMVDDTGVRPRLTANLMSRAFNLSDLAPAVGAGVQNKSTQADLTAPSADRTAHGLLPTYQFQFDRLRKTDVQVRLRADSIKTSVPIKALQLGVEVDDGLLSLDPVDLTLPQGQLSGTIRVNARGNTGVAALDLRLGAVNLAQFKPKNMAAPPIEGTLLTRVQLAGRGNSVHDMLASSNGTFTAVIPHGAVRQAFAELTGINLARGLGLLLSGNQKQTTIQCAVAAFDVDNGVARAEQLIFSTDTVNIIGSGNFNFGDENLDLQLRGQPKKVALLRLRAPILIGGTFTKPSIGVKPGELLAQAGVAAVLSAVATPAAAVLAFVDPGLAKDPDCTALLAQPKAQSVERPGPPQASPGQAAPQHTPARQQDPAH